MATESFWVSSPRKPITTTPKKTLIKKRVKNISIQWIIYPSSPKVPLNLSTKKKGLKKCSTKSVSSRVKRRSKFPGPEFQTGLPCVKVVLANFFKTVLEAETWMILSQKFFISLGVYIPARLVSKRGNWVICLSSYGFNNKGLLKGKGSSKFCYQELSFSTSKWNTLM